MKVFGLIPARLESTRLPRKLLLRETGKPLIQHVYEQAQQAQELDGLYVATDSPEIASCVKSFGGLVLLTGPAASGSDRLAQALQHQECAQIDGVINIQGDEPEIALSTINALVRSLKTTKAPMVTAVVWETRMELFHEPSVVKVVLDQQQRALYFSRAGIPYFRERMEGGFYRHIGIYGYTKSFLQQYAQFPQTPLEMAEKLEQLRALEHGFSIQTILLPEAHIGIDTSEDYANFVRRLEGK